MLRQYLADAALDERAGTDTRWAVVCTRLSRRLRDAGGPDHPHFSAAVHRIARALYWDYSLGDEFYPQFQRNVEILLPLLERIL